MMPRQNLIKLASLCALLCLSLTALARPGLLVVQLMVDHRGEQDPNVKIGSILAQELETDGRVTPLVWSLTDPIFRAAIDEGLIKAAVDKPTLNDARRAGPVLRCEYVLVCTVIRRESGLIGEMQLFRNGRQVWKYPDRAVTDGGITSEGQFGEENALRSIANTWVTLMASGPLKTLTPAPVKPIDTDITPAIKPIEPIKDPVAQVVDNSSIELARKLIREGKGSIALEMLREAVDAAPLNLDRRLALIDALYELGYPELAGNEARRAARLMPDQARLRREAARAFIRAGDAESALNELNEGLARNPNDPDVRMMVGEYYLSKSELDKALEHFDVARQNSTNGEATYRMAIVEAVRGNDVKAQELFAESQKLTLPATGSVDRYLMTVDALDGAVLSVANQMRQSMQLARVRPKDKEVAEAAVKYSKTIKSVVTVFESAIVPAAEQATHDRRLLAYRLLAQAGAEFSDFLKSPDDDMILSATINVGEAANLIEALRKRG